MVERVWYKPPEGQLVPRAPGAMAREYFPPEGDWTGRTNFIERQLARGDGTLVPGGDEEGLRAGNARREAEAQAAADEAEAKLRRVAGLEPAQTTTTQPAAEPLSRAERMTAAKEKLGYTAPLNKPAAKTSEAVAEPVNTERK